MVKNRRYEGESWFGKRHLQILLCFCCLSIAYALRVNLSVGIVAMTDKNSTNSNSVIYDWDERAKSLLLSSFFWGYVLTQIPGGQIAQHYGAKYVLLFGIVTCSLMAILTPYFASIGGWRLVMGVRIIQGMMQGCVHPATHAMLAKWAPVEERGALGTYCYSGAQFGTVAMLGASGYIAQSVSGWPAIFYSSGLCGLIWGIIWFLFSASSPAEHKTISPEERLFIEKSLGNSEQSHKTHLKTPWRNICTSVPFLALLVVHCTHMWGFWTLLTQIPSYMKNILDMDIKDSALLSALPYTVMWFLSFVFIYLSKVLAKKENVSLSYSRKLFNTLGHWIPMLSLIALAYVTSGQKTLAVVLLTLTVGINSATYLGFQVNHIDLSPNFAGTLMGITNAAANIMSSLAPLAVGFIVDDVTVQNQWRQVFFITAFFYFIGNLLFIFLGRTNVQFWNSEADRVQQPPPRISINLSMLDIHEVSKELKKVESLK